MAAFKTTILWYISLTIAVEKCGLSMCFEIVAALVIFLASKAMLEGCQCKGTSLRYTRNISRIYLSMNNVLCKISATTQSTTPTHMLLHRLPFCRCSSNTMLMLIGCFTALLGFRIFWLLMDTEQLEQGSASSTEFWPARVFIRQLVGVNSCDLIPSWTYVLKVVLVPSASFLRIGSRGHTYAKGVRDDRVLVPAFSSISHLGTKTRSYVASKGANLNMSYNSLDARVLETLVKAAYLAFQTLTSQLL